MSGRTFYWLALQEVKRLLQARWVGGGVALLSVCSVFSVLLGTRDLQEHTKSYQGLIQQRVEVQLRPSQPWGRSSEPGLRVIREPTPGAILAAGFEPALPAAWEFTPSGTEGLHTYARNASGIGARNIGDLTGIIAGLGGLLALWLGVSPVVSDRAAGRIAALRTLPVSPAMLVGVRLTGGTITLAVVAAVWCLTVGLSIQMFVPPDLEIPLSMPVWMAAPVFLYLTLMYGIGTAVGGAAKEGISAIVMAFGLWMAILFVVPQINQLITQSLADVPPQSRMEAERADNMADSARLLEQEVGAAVSTQWPDVSRVPDELQLSIYLSVGEPIWRAGLIRIRDAAALEERHWLEQRARADRLKGWLDSVNPNAWLFETMAELAGTGRTTATAWTQAIASHNRALDEKLFLNRPRVNARVLWKGQPQLLAYDRYRPPKYSDLPSFVDPPAQSGAWTPAAARNLAGLAVYTLLAMAAAYFWLWSRLR